MNSQNNMPESSPPKQQEKKEKVKPTQSGRIEPEKTLFSWKAASRPYKKRDRDFWVTVGLISAISGMILLFTEGFMPVILIISVIFLYYVLNTVEPETIEYTITNKGVKMAGKRNDYDFLGRYWFTKRYNNSIVVFESLNFGGRLEMVINPSDKDKIQKTLSKYLTYEEISPSNFDKATEWFSKKLPGNT